MYLSPVSYPSGFANRVQLMKMSEAFSRATDFSLVLGAFPVEHPRGMLPQTNADFTQTNAESDAKSVGAEYADMTQNNAEAMMDGRKNVTVNDIWKTYHVTHPFTVRALGVPTMFPSSLWFGLRARKVVASADADTVFFVRDVLLALVLVLTSKKFRRRYIFELHTLSRFPKFVYRMVLGRAKLIVTTNTAKRNDLLKMGFAEGRIFVAQNGVDKAEIEALPSQLEARKALGWAPEGFILAYIGTVAPAYGSKVLEALPALLGQNARLEIVTKMAREKAVLALSAADALIAPYEPVNEHIEKYMSPMKVREYLASGKPMIVSDLPAIRETVGEGEAWFMRAGSAEDAARCVGEMVSDSEKVRAVVARALAKADTMSWDARARAIIFRVEQALV